MLPRCNTEGMTLHLAEISAAVAPGAHAVLLLDQAGWHGSKALVVPGNITLMPLPPKCPELNPIENVWQFMRDNWLSNRVFKSYDDILDHCASPGTASPTNRGASCPSGCELGRIGSNQRVLVSCLCCPARRLNLCARRQIEQARAIVRWSVCRFHVAARSGWLK